MFEHAATSILEVDMLDDSLLLLLIVQKDFYVKKIEKLFIRENLYLQKIT